MKTYGRKSRGRQKFDADLNFDLICRLCLSEDGEMQDLFQEEESSSPRIPVQIMSSLSIAVYENDSLPTQICTGCSEMVCKYYLFKQRCEESDATLRKTLRVMREEEEEIDASPAAEEETECAEPVDEAIMETTPDKPEEEEAVNLSSLECPVPDDPQIELPSKSLDDLLPNKQTSDQPKQSVNQKPPFAIPQTVCEKRSHDMENAAIAATSDGHFIIHIEGDDDDCCEAEEDPASVAEFSIMIKDIGGKVGVVRSEGRNSEMAEGGTQEYEGEEDDGDEEEPQIIRKQVKLEPSENVVYTYDQNQLAVKRVTGQQLTFPFECLHCPKRFLKRIDLRRHLSVHQDKKGFDCETCDKWFPNLTTLRRHARSHTGERPFGCDRCGKAFSQAGILHRHLLTHTGVKPFECLHCGKGFTQREGMRVHMRSHGPKNPEDIVLHECPLCDKSFCHPSGLSRHLLVHTGKTFNCRYCSKVFTDPSSLRRHEKRHEESVLQSQMVQ